ncbi:MAG: hypothetical protein ACE14S_04795 [Candidatus Bathyarchaeia archaeon]
MQLDGRRIIAIIIFICYLSFLAIYGIFFILPVENAIAKKYEELTLSPQPRTFQVPMAIALNSSSGFSFGDSDIKINFEITCPNGTLVTNDPIDIAATVVLRNEAMYQIKEIVMVFQNWLQFPPGNDEQNLPIQGGFAFENPISAYQALNVTPPYIKLFGEGTVYWSIEGDYSPKIELIPFEGESQIFNVDTIVLHLYPQEQLAQQESTRMSLQTNQASLKLSEVVLILSTVSIVALAVQIWDFNKK